MPRLGDGGHWDGHFDEVGIGSWTQRESKRKKYWE